MRGGFYLRLAKDGISKNRKFYFPYILTCICMVMMFYIVCYLAMSADFGNVYGGDMVQQVMGLGVFVISIFSLIFLYYTNSFLIRRRQKEFGLYNILGMGKRSLIKLLVCENLLTSALSVIVGLLFGILFSKLAEMAAMKMLGGEIGFDIHVAAGPILYTAGLFVIIFLFIMLRMLYSILRLRPVEMLRSESIGEKPPKTNWVLALIGVIVLAVAYYLAVSIEDPMTAMLTFFLAVVMVIIATYMLFIAGSVALCRVLQKNKNYYYKTNHFVSLSSMIYRMRRNGAGLASICILSTMMLVTISSTVCLYAQNENAVQVRYPHNISFQLGAFDGKAPTDEATKPYMQAVDEVLAEYGQTAKNPEEYRGYTISAMMSGEKILLDVYGMSASGEWDYTKAVSVSLIPLEDYNRLTGEDRELADGEVLYYPYNMEYDGDTFDVEHFGTWKAERLETSPVSLGEATIDMIGTLFVVVKDTSVIEEAYQYGVDLIEKNNDGYVQGIFQYYDFDLDCDEDTEIEIYKDIYERAEQVSNETQAQLTYMAESRAEGRLAITALYGGLFFLGILLGAVFLFGTVLIMYYKQISEGYEDQGRFGILMKVGMTRREVKKTINSQVLTVFLLPLLVAGIHLGFAFPLVSKILGLMATAGTVETLIYVTVGCYLVFAFFYVVVYWVTSKSYYTIVNSKDK